MAPAVPLTPDPLVAHLSVRGLLALHGAIMDELRGRGVVRTSNNPVADYAEGLFTRAFKWELASNSAKGFDATDSDSLRYQIKSRWVTRFNKSRQLSIIRRLEEKAFDFLAAVVFDETYAVTRAIILPHHLVALNARFSAHSNGHWFMLEDRMWDLVGAREVTAEIRAAAEGQ